MALVELKEASNILGIHPKTLRRLVKTGKQPGQFVGRKCWVDVGGFITQPSPETVESKSGGTMKQQQYLDRKKEAEAEKEAIEAEIIRDEAIGRRDKPEKLAERVKLLEEREKEFEDRVELVERKEVVVSELEEELAQRDEAIQNKEKEIKQREFLVGQRERAISQEEARCQAPVVEVAQKPSKAEKVPDSEQQPDLASVVTMAEMQNNCQLWKNYTLKCAGYYEHIVEKDNGRYDNDTLIKITRILWGSCESFLNIAKWLKTVEDKGDVSIDSIHGAYNKRMSLVIDRVKRVRALAKRIAGGVRIS